MEYIDKIPKMTSNNSPSPYVLTSSGTMSGYDAYLAFDKVNKNTQDCMLLISKNGWFMVDMGKSEDIRKYVITSISNTTSLNQSPKKWVLEGSNDTIQWVTIDERAEQINWTVYESREYQLTKPKHFRYVRMTFLENNGGNNLGIGQFAVLGLDVLDVNSSKIILKNPTTNQHYSLAEKTLIPLPDASNETMILHGIKSGIEVRLDEDFDKIQYIVDGTVVKTMVKPLSIKFE